MSRARQGHCSNCKTRCFTLNFVADKIKIVDLFEIPNDIKVNTIKEYLENDIKTTLFFYFCYKCMRVRCGLDNPKECHNFKGNNIFDRFFGFFCPGEKKMYKILTCHCKRHRLDQLNVNYTYNYSFSDCHCSGERKVFATKCNNCRYNLVGFAINYLASVICSFYQTDRNFVFRHCRQLLHDLNFNTMKVCLSEKDVPKEFELLEIEKYHEMYLKADPFFSI